MRCLAAASATTRPTAVEPVKKMWSHRSASSAVVSSTPPSTTTTASGSTYCGSSRAIAAEQARRQLRGLGQHAVAGGQGGADRLDEELDRVVPRARSRGPRPSGSGTIHPLAGCTVAGSRTLVGFIQPPTCLARWRSSSLVWPMSAANASTFGRPRSTRSASTSSSSPSSIIRRSPASCASRHATGRVRPRVEGGPQLLVERGRIDLRRRGDRHGRLATSRPAAATAPDVVTSSGRW